MKNILAILALVALLPSVAYSNTWKHNYYVDEFGDKTNNAYVKSDVTGSMTNSATTNGKGTLVFFFGMNARTRNSPNLEIRVFSHGRFPESFYEAKDIIAKVKHNGNVREIVVVYVSGESLMIHVKDAVWMWETLKRRRRLFYLDQGRKNLLRSEGCLVKFQDGITAIRADL